MVNDVVRVVQFVERRVFVVVLLGGAVNMGRGSNGGVCYSMRHNASVP